MKSEEQFGNPFDGLDDRLDKTADALEIVRLLEEMRKSQCCVYATVDMWIVEFMDVINEKYDIISMEKDLLKCLQIACSEGWKP